MWCRGSRSELPPPGQRPAGTAGFTLIEVLVAIAVLAVVLGAIGTVVGTTVRSIRSVDRRLPLLETAQSLLAALPAREALLPGSQSGASGEYRWRIDAVALDQKVPDSAKIETKTEAKTETKTDVSTDAKTAKWMPLAITVRVQGSEGPPVRLDTVRLVPRPPG
jgi:general secretion pathway protein I